jgi:serine protease
MEDKVDDYEERYGAGIVNANAAASNSVWCRGLTRLGGGLLAAFLILLGVRRKDILGDTNFGKKLPFIAGLIMASSGLFFLAGLLPDGGAIGTAIGVLGRPLAMLDLTLLGPEFHQTAVMASALIPMALVLLGLGNPWLRSLSAGVAIGFAGFLFAEAFMLNADILWVPGIGLLDRGWLAVNAVVCAGLGYLTLKRY